MTIRTTQKNRHFCIFDYFLDGVFLRWEEIEGECPVFVRGQDWVINLEDGTQISAKIIETEAISENERRIFLRSC
jgi:hypothetical protein